MSENKPYINLLIVDYYQHVNKQNKIRKFHILLVKSDKVNEKGRCYSKVKSLQYKATGWLKHVLVYDKSFKMTLLAV